MRKIGDSEWKIWAKTKWPGSVFKYRKLEEYQSHWVLYEEMTPDNEKNTFKTIE